MYKLYIVVIVVAELAVHNNIEYYVRTSLQNNVVLTLVVSVEKFITLVGAMYIRHF